MTQIDDALCVEALILFCFVILAGVFSVMGPDSRDYRVNDRRGWWPGRR